MQPAGAHGVEEIADAESGTHVIGSKEFAAWAKRKRALRHHLGSQRNIAGNDQILGPCPTDNFVIRHIESLTHLQRADVGSRGLYDRQPDRSENLIHHSDRGTQYVSIPYTERLSEAGIEPSVGSKGDRYDNALAETINGLYKAELIHRRGPWKTMESIELATLEWVSWFNNGILKDRSVAGGNVLTGPVFDALPQFAGPKVIYAAANRMGARAARESITFKQTPYALEV